MIHLCIVATFGTGNTTVCFIIVTFSFVKPSSHQVSVINIRSWCDGKVLSDIIKCVLFWSSLSIVLEDALFSVVLGNSC